MPRPPSPPPYTAEMPSHHTEASHESEGEGEGAGYEGVNLQNPSEMEEVPPYEFHPAQPPSFDVAELKTTEEGVYVVHYISNVDTLVGISLKYNVPVGFSSSLSFFFYFSNHFLPPSPFFLGPRDSQGQPAFL